MKIHLLLLLALLILPLTATLAPDASEAKKKKKQHKTVTRTFTDFTGAGIASNGQIDGSPMTFVVKGLKKGKIRDVNLDLPFLHSNADDLDFLLVAPNGDNALVMSDAGGQQKACPRILLDDEAAAPLPDSGPLSTEPCSPSIDFQDVTFRPANYTPIGDSDAFPGAPSPSGDVSLSTFDGGNPNGTWRLFVSDDFTSDGGFISSVRLIVKARVKTKK